MRTPAPRGMASHYLRTFERVPVNKSLLTGTFPANKSLLTGTVPANKNLLAGTVPANKRLLAGTVQANNSIHLIMCPIAHRRGNPACTMAKVTKQLIIVLQAHSLVLYVQYIHCNIELRTLIQ